MTRPLNADKRSDLGDARGGLGKGGGGGSDRAAEASWGGNQLRF
jgi:hypothetical protein